MADRSLEVPAIVSDGPCASLLLMADPMAQVSVSVRVADPLSPGADAILTAQQLRGLGVFIDTDESSGWWRLEACRCRRHDSVGPEADYPGRQRHHLAVLPPVDLQSDGEPSVSAGAPANGIRVALGQRRHQPDRARR